jgi:hypothetical protein
MSETVVADTWLYGRLAGDAELMSGVTGVFADVAPEGTAFPFVVFSFQSGRDTVGLGGTRIFTGATYQVKVISDKPSYGAIKALANRIDAVLHQASGAVADGTVISSVREEPVRYTETTAGKQFRHLGGLYRLQVQASQ